MRDGRGGNIRTLPPRDQVQELHWNGVIARGSVMAMSRYGQFCPVAKASEILTERWTPVILRDLLAGSHRFNEIRKGVPLMSPSLLSTRLKMLEREGVIERRHTKSNGSVEYHLTPAGRELEPFVQFLGTWGQRWVRDRLHEDELDPGLLMWGIRGGIDPGVFPAGRTVIQFEFTDVRAPKKSLVAGRRERARGPLHHRSGLWRGSVHGLGSGDHDPGLDGGFAAGARDTRGRHRAAGRRVPAPEHQALVPSERLRPGRAAGRAERTARAFEIRRLLKPVLINDARTASQSSPIGRAPDMPVEPTHVGD